MTTSGRRTSGSNSGSGREEKKSAAMCPQKRLSFEKLAYQTLQALHPNKKISLNEEQLDKMRLLIDRYLRNQPIGLDGLKRKRKDSTPMGSTSGESVHSNSDASSSTTRRSSRKALPKWLREVGVGCTGKNDGMLQKCYSAAVSEATVEKAFARFKKCVEDRHVQGSQAVKNRQILEFLCGSQIKSEIVSEWTPQQNVIGAQLQCLIELYKVQLGKELDDTKAVAKSHFLSIISNKEESVLFCEVLRNVFGAHIPNELERLQQRVGYAPHPNFMPPNPGCDNEMCHKCVLNPSNSIKEHVDGKLVDENVVCEAVVNDDGAGRLPISNEDSNASDEGLIETVGQEHNVIEPTKTTGADAEADKKEPSTSEVKTKTTAKSNQSKSDEREQALSEEGSGKEAKVEDETKKEATQTIQIRKSQRTPKRVRRYSSQESDVPRASPNDAKQRRPFMVDAKDSIASRRQTKKRLCVVSRATNLIIPTSRRSATKLLEKASQRNGSLRRIPIKDEIPAKRVKIEVKEEEIVPKPAPKRSRKRLEPEVLTKDALTRYRKRMINVYEMSKELRRHEVFYGRCNARRGLFDEPEKKPEKKTSESRTKQKNRSGRSTKKNLCDCLYFAHTLLNVHNPDPLSSGLPKLAKTCGQDGQFKLKKLVRHANRAKAIKLNKWQQQQKLLQMKKDEVEASANV